MKQFITWVLAVVLCGTALAFGGVESGVYTAAEIAVFAGFFILLFQQTRAGAVRLPLPVWPLLFLLWAAFALAPLPPFLVRTLSPHRLMDLTLVSADAASKWTPLSVYSHDTQVALLKFAAYVVVFVLAAWLHDSPSHHNAVLNVLIGLACFEAAYGMIQYLTGWQKIFGYTKVVDLSEATGTYINRDHFAALLEMITPFIFALAFYQFQARLARGSRHGAWPDSARTSGAGARTILFLFLLAVITLAVVFSQSRGGILAATLSLIMMLLLTQAKTRHKGWTITVLLFFMAVLSYGLWIGLGPVLTRFESMRESASLEFEARPAIWADTLRLCRDFPLFGSGLGTFGVAFKPHQTKFVSYFVDHAHNEYLETAAETGWVGAALLVVPIVVLWVRMVLSFLDDPRHYRRAITLGATGSILAILVHSLFDFNLHIPANAFCFAFILGIGYKASCVERREEGRRPGGSLNG